MTPVGHSGFLGTGFVGPTAVPFVTAGTATMTAGGAGSAQLDRDFSNFSTRTSGEEWHVHTHIAVKPKQTTPTASPIYESTISSPLDAAIAFVAVGGVVSTGSAVVWHTVRRWRHGSDDIPTDTARR